MIMALCVVLHFCFFNDTATTEIYTLSLHDALPIYSHSVPPGPIRRALGKGRGQDPRREAWRGAVGRGGRPDTLLRRSEEHTSELQSRQYLVCRLLLEKKTAMVVEAPEDHEAACVHV